MHRQLDDIVRPQRLLPRQRAIARGRNVDAVLTHRHVLRLLGQVGRDRCVVQVDQRTAGSVVKNELDRRGLDALQAQLQILPLTLALGVPGARSAPPAGPWR